jgi:hypothetical protein
MSQSQSKMEYILPNDKVNINFENFNSNLNLNDCDYE